MSNTQKSQKALAYFINNIPVGEVRFALNDLRTLVPDQNVFGTQLQAQMLHDYNIKQMVHFDTGNGKFITTPYNEVNARTYYDPSTLKLYEVDHIEKTVTSEVGVHKSSGYESQRAALQEAMKIYSKEHYKNDKCVTGVFVNGNELIICVSAINTNLNAYWTGNWRGTYRLDTSSGRFLGGKLEVNVHYFEDGNVQLNAEYEVKEFPTVNGLNDVAGIVKAIETIETEWQGNIETMYVDMHHSTFKQMRRALPLSRTLFNWGSSAHVLQRELGK